VDNLCALGQEYAMSDLQPGDKAPAFTLPTDGGDTIRLSKLKGTLVVLYFYPKDDTPGCTLEALNFSAQAKAFAKAGAVVVGVSRDSPEKHHRFKAKHGLNLILASDESGETLESYGVWKEKSLYGRKFMGIERSTFLLGKDGRIVKIWRKVKVADHAEAVLTEVNNVKD
jgi:thioredoxin-dependent peroxiredoxin